MWFASLSLQFHNLFLEGSKLKYYYYGKIIILFSEEKEMKCYILLT